MKKNSLTIAGVCFSLIAIMQFLRYYFGITVIVGNGHSVPLWVSLWAAILFAALGLWMFAAAICKKCCCCSHDSAGCHPRDVKDEALKSL